MFDKNISSENPDVDSQNINKQSVQRIIQTDCIE